MKYGIPGILYPESYSLVNMVSNTLVNIVWGHHIFGEYCASQCIPLVHEFGTTTVSSPPKVRVVVFCMVLQDL